MAFKALSITLMTLVLAQHASAWDVIGDRHATSPASSDIEKRADYQCNFYSDDSCANYIGHAVASGPFGKCQSGWGAANSYLCFNNNDVEQIDIAKTIRSIGAFMRVSVARDLAKQFVRLRLLGATMWMEANAE
ncbi:hypothetical protein ACMFMF_000733 [Clarireedia jacksonii]